MLRRKDCSSRSDKWLRISMEPKVTLDFLAISYIRKEPGSSVIFVHTRSSIEWR